MHTAATQYFLTNSIRWAPTLTPKILTFRIQTSADAERADPCIPAMGISAIPRAIVNWMGCISRVIWPLGCSNRELQLSDLKTPRGTTIRNNDLSSSKRSLTAIAVSYRQTLYMPAVEWRLVFWVTITLLSPTRTAVPLANSTRSLKRLDWMTHRRILQQKKIFGREIFWPTYFICSMTTVAAPLFPT